MQHGGSGLFHFITPVICRNSNTTDLQPIRQKAGKNIEIQTEYIPPCKYAALLPHQPAWGTNFHHTAGGQIKLHLQTRNFVTIIAHTTPNRQGSVCKANDTKKDGVFLINYILSEGLLRMKKKKKKTGLTLCSRCTSPTVQTPGLDHGVAEHTAECPLKPPATNLLIKYTIPGHNLPCNSDPQSASRPQQSHGS